jgi:ATP-dependent exoDNAse (exonuclease V) alpha subunit
VPRIIELVKTRTPKRFGFDPIRDIQVLCPMNRGGAGARSLNIELQAAFNRAGERKVERFGWIFTARRQGLYCGPVLRHPAVPIQAANFRPTVAF